jgi:hypothetical protein
MTKTILVVSGCLAVAVAAACGGKVVTDSSESSDRRGAGSDGPGGASDTLPPGRVSAGGDLPSTVGSECRHAGGGGSSSGTNGNFHCTALQKYTCGEGYRQLECECSGKVGGPLVGKCTCSYGTPNGGGVGSFSFDCANFCTPGAEALRACGIPAPSSSSGG